ncbi:hypothetical protein SLE2022_187960 [Rubroshorea leprosula]
MAKMNFTLLWALALICLSGNADGKAKSRETLSDVDRKLKLLNKPAVKSILSDDGDIIDCVDIHKQPAFDHPALRTHVIQMKPSFDARIENLGNRSHIVQTWQRSGTCPEGTIPIRRIRKQDLLRAASLENFGRKLSHNTSNNRDQNGSHFIHINNNEVVVSPIVRSTAYLVTVGYNYIGASGDINVWNPRVDLPEDFTSGQIWVRGGPGDNFESIESVWVVNPKLYGDTRTRFFAYWTKDAYNQTGCFDLTCSGFIQTSSHVALGAAIEPCSSTSGPQYYIPIGIFMDTNTSNWWLRYSGTEVGYWPAGTLLFYLNYSSTMVQWGGDVYSQNVRKSPHTKTAMGSGEFASATGLGNACFIQHVRIMDFSRTLKYPEWVSTWADEPYCYSSLNWAPYGVEPVFYFGGPGGGYDYMCP